MSWRIDAEDVTVYCGSLLSTILFS